MLERLTCLLFGHDIPPGPTRPAQASDKPRPRGCHDWCPRCGVGFS